MAIKTKNSTETTRNSRKQQYFFGVEEHQNDILTGSRWKFGKTHNNKHKFKNLQDQEDSIWYARVLCLITSRLADGYRLYYVCYFTALFSNPVIRIEREGLLTTDGMHVGYEKQ